MGDAEDNEDEGALAEYFERTEEGKRRSVRRLEPPKNQK